MVTSYWKKLKCSDYQMFLIESIHVMGSHFYAIISVSQHTICTVFLIAIEYCFLFVAFSMICLEKNAQEHTYVGNVHDETFCQKIFE